MKYLSLCSGIEAASVAWNHLGWEPVAFSEIDKFPSEVLKYHYPHVPNLGDMTKYKEWNIGTVDLVVGGTPCQSFSVAGLRKGLEDPRGNLMLTYVAILNQFRPQWFVWENVQGVLSSNGGRDFGSFLGAVAQLGYGFAYRVLDAQYFGVAQRRRRVFVVGCFGNWERAAKILFESESLSRNTPKSRKTREEITENIAPSLTCGFGKSSGQDLQPGLINAVPFSADCVGTLLARDYKGLDSYDHTKMIAYSANTCPTITSSAAGYSRVGNPVTEHETYVATQVAFRKSRRAQSNTDYETWVNDDKANTLNTFDLGDIRTTHAVAHSQILSVRRLTVVECERLQGFPDNYTNIKENCPDGPRYKALGNSMAVPVMQWIGDRIHKENYHAL